MIAEEGRCRMSTMTCYRSVGCDRWPTGARGLNPRADVCAWCAEIAATDLLGVAGIFLVHERSLFSLCAGMREWPFPAPAVVIMAILGLWFRGVGVSLLCPGKRDLFWLLFGCCSFLRRVSASWDWGVCGVIGMRVTSRFELFRSTSCLLYEALTVEIDCFRCFLCSWEECRAVCFSLCFVSAFSCKQSPSWQCLLYNNRPARCLLYNRQIETVERQIETVFGLFKHM